MLRRLALVLLASIALRALTMPDDGYDSWAYHLPFAARLWGIVPREGFEMDHHLEVLFGSYPVLAEWLQGALWTVVGRPQAANLVSLFSLLGFIAFLARRCSVPWHVATLACLAIPVVQVHATSDYVDLAGNVAAAVAIVSCFRVWSKRDLGRSDHLLGLGGAVLAANVKYVLLPVALLAFLVLALAYLTAPGNRSRLRAAEIAIAFLALSVFYCRNAVVHGHPLHPMHVSVGSLEIAAGPMHFDFEGPSSLASYPGPLRWLASVLGWGELDPARGYWNTDASGVEGAWSFRMGGYLGPWVIANVVLLVALVRRQWDRTSRVAIVTVGVTTLVVSWLPNAHQLRYFMCWMLTLVGINASLLARDLPRRARDMKIYALLAGSALASVLTLTRGQYVLPTAATYGWSRLVLEKTDSRVSARLKPGGRYCLVGMPGYAFLYASEVRGSASYSLKSAGDEAQCGTREVIPLP